MKDRDREDDRDRERDRDYDRETGTNGDDRKGKYSRLTTAPLRLWLTVSLEREEPAPVPANDDLDTAE